MGIQKIDDVDNTVAKFKLSNGDYVALKSIMKHYGIKDETSALAFALGLLNRAEGRPITLTQADGSTVTLTPADSIKEG